MYPLKFNKILKEKVWGGRYFSELFHKPLNNNLSFGESWEVASHKNGMSIVTNGEFSGKSLQNLIDEFGSDLLGVEVKNKYLNKFPLLVKYLDINDKLSVQVHPNDDYALKREGEFGKFESWYVMEASDNAKLILGVADNITKDEFDRRVKNQDFNHLFREVPVKKGDFIDIKPGLVHASLEGNIVICEIQQNSDTTYRIYDFNRLENGVLRDLHIDKSLDVIDFNLVPEISCENKREKHDIYNGYVEVLTNNEFYNIEKIHLNNGSYTSHKYKNFKILSVLEGIGHIQYKNGNIEVSQGDTFLIPAELEVSLNGRLEVLNSYI